MEARLARARTLATGDNDPNSMAPIGGSWRTSASAPMALGLIQMVLTSSELSSTKTHLPAMRRFGGRERFRLKTGWCPRTRLITLCGLRIPLQRHPESLMTARAPHMLAALGLAHLPWTFWSVAFQMSLVVTGAVFAGVHTWVNPLSWPWALLLHCPPYEWVWSARGARPSLCSCSLATRCSLWPRSAWC